MKLPPVTRKNGGMLAFAVWKQELFSVPIPIALEEGRRPTLCAVFPAKFEIDPVFWRATTYRDTTKTIAANVNWMFTTEAFEDKPKPVAVLAGIPADVFFAALSGRLFGDDPSDASGETGAIFRLALTLLPNDLPLDDMLAVINRFGLRVWPLLGMYHMPAATVGKNVRYWLPLPDDVWDCSEFKNAAECDQLLQALIAQPGGHSALHRASVMTTPFENEEVVV